MKKVRRLFLVLIMVLFVTACKRDDDITSSSKPEPTESSQPTDYPDGDGCDKARVEADDGWIPVWCEEFDYTGAPNPAKWIVEHKGDGFGNNELQYYTPRKDNVYVENGELRITVKKELYRGKNYTSAKLMSVGKGDFLYGRIEVRAKLPQGRGTWPAIWMMPTESVYGGWPKSGEIDIMEHVGYDPNRIHGTIHTENYNHMIGTQKGRSIQIDNAFDYYHLYAIEWDPYSIKWFVDGHQYFEFRNDHVMNPDGSSANWPFNQPFYIILNVAFGGNWGGAQGIDPNFVESHMYVDYVRVYQKDYGRLDESPPEAVRNFRVIDPLPTNMTIYWDHPNDDLGISHYLVYLNGQLIRETRANSITLEPLLPVTDYELKVVAVDFTNKESEAATFIFTTGNYPSILDTINASSAFEKSGVFLQNTLDIGGGQNVFGFDPGDYLLFRLSVPETGNYRVLIRVAAIEGPDEVEIIEVQYYNGDSETERVLTTIQFDATGHSQIWRTVTGQDQFTLNEGMFILKVRANSKHFSLNWVVFEKVND